MTQSNREPKSAEPREATEADREFDKLVRFFNSPEGYSWGQEGDIANWTPVETAIRVMRRQLPRAGYEAALASPETEHVEPEGEV